MSDITENTNTTQTPPIQTNNFTGNTNAAQNVGHVYPLLDAVLRGDLPEVTKLVDEDETLLTQPLESDESILHIACTSTNLEVTKYFVEKGANIDLQDRHGCTPLYTAVVSKQYDNTQYLIEQGAALELADIDGKTPFYIACQRGWLDIMDLLLAKGADIECRAPAHYNFTPLNVAAYENNFATVQWLVEHGAPLRALDSFGETSMFSGCFHGNYELVRYLIEAGDDPMFTGNKNTLPVAYAEQYAKEPGKTWTVQYLKAAMEGKGHEYEPEPVDGVEFVPSREEVYDFLK
jgi:ankyrin repeat protein